MTFECKINSIKKYHCRKLFLVLDLNALGVIPLVCKNGLYDMEMANLFYSLLATPTIPAIKIVALLAP
jgi:hypothetical protein